MFPMELEYVPEGQTTGFADPSVQKCPAGQRSPTTLPFSSMTFTGDDVFEPWTLPRKAVEYRGIGRVRVLRAYCGKIEISDIWKRIRPLDWISR